MEPAGRVMAAEGSSVLAAYEAPEVRVTTQWPLCVQVRLAVPDGTCDTLSFSWRLAPTTAAVPTRTSTRVSEHLSGTNTAHSRTRTLEGVATGVVRDSVKIG